MNKYDASSSVVRRLPRYYRLLQEMERNQQSRTSSRELGQRLGMTPSQIRQDLSCFGCFGQQGYGYSVVELRENLEKIMGLKEPIQAVLVGAGILGKVVSENVSFRDRGFELAAIFDTKEELLGKTLAGLEIRSMQEIEQYCAEHHPTAAILCLPKEEAQCEAEHLVRLGIRGIWNFSHCDIRVENACVVTVHLDDSLMTLSYKMHNNNIE